MQLLHHSCSGSRHVRRCSAVSNLARIYSNPEVTTALTNLYSLQTRVTTHATLLSREGGSGHAMIGGGGHAMRGGRRKLLIILTHHLARTATPLLGGGCHALRGEGCHALRRGGCCLPRTRTKSLQAQCANWSLADCPTCGRTKVLVHAASSY